MAAAIVELSADDLRDIDEAAKKITVQGGRYSEPAHRMINR
jgi:hypothetical protein